MSHGTLTDLEQQRKINMYDMFTILFNQKVHLGLIDKQKLEIMV